MKKIGILGSTGSIGSQALEILDEFKEEFEFVFISGNSTSDFYDMWSNTANLFIGADIEGWGWPDYQIDIPNNVSNWQYNYNLGTYGFYSTISIPSDIDYVADDDMIVC